MISINKKKKLVLLLFFLFCFSLISLFGVRNSIKNISTDLVKIDYEIKKEKDFVKILKADYTNLSKSHRIIKLAKDKLGLGQAKSYQIIKLSDFKKKFSQ